jgi:tetratricopeptide (TPR) repeat protein
MIKAAYEAASVGKFEEAVFIFPNYPIAWVNFYESVRGKSHKEQQGQLPFEWLKEKILDPAAKACPFSLEITRLWIDVYMRYDKYQDAAKIIQSALEKRPDNAPFLMALCHCFREIGLRAEDQQGRTQMFVEARDCGRYLRDIDMQMRNDAVSWIYRDNSEIPTPHEGGPKCST